MDFRTADISLHGANKCFYAKVMYVKSNDVRKHLHCIIILFFNLPDGPGDPSSTVPSSGAGKSKSLLVYSRGEYFVT